MMDTDISKENTKRGNKKAYYSGCYESNQEGDSHGENEIEV